MKYGAGNAIDLDLQTYSYTVAGTDGTSWLKVTLAEEHCLQKVIWYPANGTPFLTWTCNKDDCSNCVGQYCSAMTVTVSGEGSVTDLPPVSNCKHGDTVRLEKVSGEGFGVHELAIIGKPGKST